MIFIFNNVVCPLYCNACSISTLTGAVTCNPNACWSGYTYRSSDGTCQGK